MLALVLQLLYKDLQITSSQYWHTLPFNLNCFPCCVPAGILIFDLPPSIEGTSTEVPNDASEKEIGNS